MSDIKISRTQKALRLIQDEGITAKEAAERVGITNAAVSKGKCHPSKTQQKIRMLSEMQKEIESLRQQLAEKDAEIEQWKANSRENKLIAEECVRREQELRQQLSAGQSSEQQLRETIGLWIGIAANCSIESGCCHCGDSMENHASPFSCGHSPVDIADTAVYNAIKKSDEAISTQSDTTALSAMITKAGEVMRELAIGEAKSLADCEDNATKYRAGASFCCEKIRALPGVTLEDLSK